MNYRLYTFTAHHFLSPLQCGIQSAHVVSELANMHRIAEEQQRKIFELWAGLDKTIIVCGAGNHEGVTACWAKMVTLVGKLGLPVALFKEDERSMNGMATACGVIVPQKYWDVTFEKEENVWVHEDTYSNDEPAYHYFGQDDAEGQLISHIKNYRLV
jgi:hypothetical protein